MKGLRRSRTGDPARLTKAEHAHRCQDPAWGYVSPGESRWPACIAVLAVMVLQMTLPEQLTLGPNWLLPTVELVVLAMLVIVGPTHLDEEAKDLRIVALTLIAVVAAADGTTLGLLMHHLLRAGDSIKGRTLIFSAVGVWFTAVVAFALLYWEIDRGGPIARCRDDHAAPDFLFTQMGNPTTTREPWTPRFLDYLYMSVTNSTAFSPTDTLPLTLRAKALMSFQSLAQLATVVVVGARAVNILK